MSNGRLTEQDLAPHLTQKINNTAAQAQDLETRSEELATQLAQTIENVESKGINVKLLGAVGDGYSHPLSEKYTTLAEAQKRYPHASSLTDELDWCAIQLAINDFNDVDIPSGIYTMSRPIKYKTGVRVNGYGYVEIKAGLNIWSENHTIIELFNVDNTMTRNIHINQDGSNRNNTNAINHSLFLSGAKDNIFEDITFLDSGLNPDTTGSLPSGAPLQLVAKDLEDDRDEGVVGAVLNNKFIRVKIIQNGLAKTQFGLRVLTNWDKLRPQTDFKNVCAYNDFENCEWHGDFDWNHLEFAGGGTKYNTVMNCKITGKSLSAIDFDKGASYNTAGHNKISSGGTPQSYIGNTSNRLAVLHDHGSNESYMNVGNSFLYNIIQDIGSTDNEVYQAALSTIYTKGSKFIGNIIENLNSGSIGQGVLIDRYVYDCTIEKNRFTNVFRGLRTNSNGTNVDNLKIINNYIESTNNAILIGGSAANVVKNLAIEGNVLTCTVAEGISMSNAAIAPSISKNNINSTSDSVKTSALNARITENTIHSNATFAFRIQENCILAFNVIVGTITTPTTVTAGKVVKTSLNSWEI